MKASEDFDCACLTGETDWCETCREWVDECPCWQDDETGRDTDTVIVPGDLL